MSARATTLHRVSPLIAVLVLMASWPGDGRRVHAGFVAGNLAANNGFNTQNGFNVTGPQAVNGQAYGVAVEFQTSSPVAVSFDSALLGLTYRTGTNAINVSLMTSAGGLPSGTPLETMHVTGIAAGPNLVTVNSSAHSILAAGAIYWLVANYGGADTNVGWLANTTHQAGDAAYRPDTTSTMGSWVYDRTDADPSFAIYGSNLVPTSAGTVDAPPSALLVGIGCLGLLSGHYLRRRQPPRRASRHSQWVTFWQLKANPRRRRGAGGTRPLPAAETRRGPLPN